MAPNPFEQAREILKKKGQEFLTTTRGIGQQVNNVLNKQVQVSQPVANTFNQVQNFSNRLTQGVTQAPVMAGKTLGGIGRAVGTGFVSGGTAGIVTPKYAPQNVIEQAGNIAGNVAGLFNPYTPAAKGFELLGKVGSSVGSRVALKTLPKIGVKGLAATKGSAAELAQTLGYAGASKLGSTLGLNEQKDQFAPGNLASNMFIGLGLRGATSPQATAEIRNLFGRSKEVATNLREVDALVDMYKMGSKEQKAKAKDLIRLSAERSAPKDAMDKFVDDPLKLAREIKKNLTSKNPQFNPTLNRLAEAPAQPTQPVAEAFDPKKYVSEMVQKQTEAKGGTKTNFLSKSKSTLSDMKEKIVDSLSPVEDALSSAEKKYNFKTLPTQDFRIQVGKVIRSKTIASKFAEDNGLVDAIRKAPDLEMLDQYMIAKQAARVKGLGKQTGRDLAKDQQLIESLSGVYEPIAKEVNNYSRTLLNYAVDSGLVDAKTAAALIKKYPDYVPLNRVFGEGENVVAQGSKSLASLPRQSVVQTLKGSEREIASPIESLLQKTQSAFAEGEKNKAAKLLASYKDLPGFQNLITELKGPAKGAHTISYLDNGVKRTFAVTKEIEAAAKSLNSEQMGLLGKIFSTPTRVVQLGATGLNVPFVVTNIFKDQFTTFVNSNKAAKTSILNPANFVKALFAAVEHNDLYDELVRAGAGGTSFDIARQAPNLTVQRIRAGRSTASKIKYTVTHPGELLRAVEDIIGRGEEVARVQNYAGTKQSLLKEGRTAADAVLLAAKAARENTADFARKGSWGKVLNWMIPFFNAGVQGARQTVRSFQNNPVGTSFKVATSLFMPAAVATVWNLSDPQRKQVYEDIPQYEKENNLIIIPPNATQNSRGQWNVIKIPIPPGLSNLTSLVRRPLEQANGMDPVKFSEIANNLITAGTSVDLSSPNKIASTFTPALIKPVVEGVTNTNLFTGQKIVPEYMKNLPPEAQVRPDTSAFSRTAGRVLNVSPLLVENAAGTIGGGLGRQITGQESPVGNLQRRFSLAQGGAIVGKIFDDSDRVMGIESQIKNLVKSGQTQQAKALVEKNRDLLLKGQTVKQFRQKVSDLYADKRKAEQSFTLTSEQKAKVLAEIQKRLNAYSQAYSNFERGVR